jgi:hypothetical protein
MSDFRAVMRSILIQCIKRKESICSSKILTAVQCALPIFVARSRQIREIRRVAAAPPPAS